MKLGIVDMEANFVPGSGNQMGYPPEEWKRIPPLARLERVLDVIDDSHFDYVELGMPWLQQDITPKGATPVLDLVQSRKCKPRAFCSFVPESVKTAGPDFDLRRIKDYLTYVLPICEAIGGDIVVFGSGPSRTVPAGYDKRKAFDELRLFLLDAAQAIDQHGYCFRIAIEPLCAEESNMINSLGEAYELAEAVGSPHVGVLLDLYHARLQTVPFEDELPSIANRLFHIHLAEPEDRGWPGHLGDEGFNFDECFRLLKSIGYEGNASVECKFGNLPHEIESCHDFLRECITRNYA